MKCWVGGWVKGSGSGRGIWHGWVWGGGWVGGPGQKTSNLSPCPVPLVVKLNEKCWGSVETDAYLAEFGSEWTDGFKGIRLEGLKLALVQNYKSTFTIFLVTTCGIITTAGQLMADSE